MPNKTSAREWLLIAFHDLFSAKSLFKSNHYNDTIGLLLQQALEKILKSILAFGNKPIKKSHDLVELYSLMRNELNLTNSEIEILEIATGYYSDTRYPNAFYSLPNDDEIKDVLVFADSLYTKVCMLLGVDIEEIDIK